MTAEPPQERDRRYQLILGALTAAAGADLRVIPQPELRGASVAGSDVEAYVLAVSDGYQVDLWRHDGNDAYRIELFGDLDDATDLAIVQARSN